MSSSLTKVVESLSKTELSERDKLRIGAAYQQMFWETGNLPTADVVFNMLRGTYDLPLIQMYAESEEFQNKLENLGLKTDSPVAGLLTPEQILVANMELSILDKRSIRQKIEELKAGGIANISLYQVEAWKRDPAFQDYVSKRAKAIYESLEPEAYKVLAKGIANGDMKAVQMLLEMKGKYAKNINMNVNVESVMIKMIEIVSNHIDDPAILEAIASDFEALDI